MAIRIRQGVRDDAAFLANVMLIASRGHLKRGVWDLIIGRDDKYALEYLRQLAIAEPISLCHYTSFIVAECDGRPAAGLCGFDPREGGWPVVMQNQNVVAEQMGWTPADFQKSGERSAPAWTCLPGEAAGAWIIENVATLPEFRRRGLADTLLAEMLEEGRRRGNRICQLTLLIGNDPAQKAYEKAGFKFFDEKRNPAFEAAIGSPGFRRLMREL